MQIWELLKCPNCRQAGNLVVVAANLATCERCGKSISFESDVLDFVAGSETTALDVAAYDAEKEVSIARSRVIFNHLRTRAGTNLPAELGDVLEIGAGTGLLTLGMLSGACFRRAVVTDISAEMLAVCRARAEQFIDLKKVLFATYSGKEDIFPENSYDFCIANSVMHHILDYRAFLRNVQRLLKLDGRALFVEPSGEFHRAMTGAMSDALVLLMAQAAVISEGDVRALCTWISERRAGFIFPDQLRPEVEDKHLFFRGPIDIAARDAGFTSVTFTAWDHDRLGLGALTNYCTGLGLSPEFQELFYPIYNRYAAHHFGNISVDDMSSMYVITLRK